MARSNEVKVAVVPCEAEVIGQPQRLTRDGPNSAYNKLNQLHYEQKESKESKKSGQYHKK